MYRIAAFMGKDKWVSQLQATMVHSCPFRLSDNLLPASCPTLYPQRERLNCYNNRKSHWVAMRAKENTTKISGDLPGLEVTELAWERPHANPGKAPLVASFSRIRPAVTVL